MAASHMATIQTKSQRIVKLLKLLFHSNYCHCARRDLGDYSSVRPQTVFFTRLFSSVFKPGCVRLTIPLLPLVLLLSWFCIASR